MYVYPGSVIPAVRIDVTIYFYGLIPGKFCKKYTAAVSFLVVHRSLFSITLDAKTVRGKKQLLDAKQPVRMRIVDKKRKGTWRPRNIS
jgi:hypothetical protein